MVSRCPGLPSSSDRYLIRNEQHVHTGVLADQEGEFASLEDGNIDDRGANDVCHTQCLLVTDHVGVSCIPRYVT